LRQTAKSRGWRTDAVDDLVDGVDRFPFARTAAENEDPRDEVEVIIVSVMAVIFVVLMQNDFGDTDGLTAVAAMHTAEVLRRQFNRHEDYSLERFGQAWKAQNIK
jgi:hypothetical protein